MDLSTAWDRLIADEVVTSEEAALVCDVAGDNWDTLESVLYSRYGYRTMDQYLGFCEDCGEEEDYCTCNYEG